MSDHSHHRADKAHDNNPIPNPSGHIHPQKYQDDLNPAPLAGQNFGLEGPHHEKDAPTAVENKEIHRLYPHLRNDELKEIPILPEGSRLEQGAKYFDFHAPERGEITATSEMIAGPQNWYAPKSDVDYQLWNRLLGVQNPERLGNADDKNAS